MTHATKPGICLSVCLTLAGSAFLPAQQTTTLPQRFVRNAGQWAPEVHFMTARPGAAAWFVDGGWRVRIDGADDSFVFDQRIGGSNVRPAAGAALPGLHHFLVGDQDRWRRDISATAGLRYQNVARDIDVIVRQGSGVVFEFLVHAGAGARLSDFWIECSDVEQLRVDEDGSLRFTTPIGEIRQTAPNAWIEDGGNRKPVACHYVLTQRNRFGFAVPGWDGASDLVIDPGLVYGSYLGGNALDYCQAAATNTAGETLLLGDTASTDFPTSTGAYKTKVAGTDCFLSLLSADGKSLVASTLIGGSSTEVGRGLAFGVNGDFVICGETLSSDFPITSGAFQSKHAGGAYDVFVARISKDGKNLVFGTFLGGTRTELAGGVHVNAIDEITVVGTGTVGFPTTTGAFQTTLPSKNNFYNPFITRLSRDGKTAIYSSFLGGTNFGSAFAVWSDLRGNVFVGGQTGSSDFPVTTGAYQTSGNLGINFNGFVARLGANGKPTWATYLGGSGMNRVTAVHADSTGVTTVAGWTLSINFPITINGYQRTYGGQPAGFAARGDGFVAKLDANGAKLLASTYLGGTGDDELHRLHVDANGNVTVSGNTGSSDFPVSPGCLRAKAIAPPYANWQAEAIVARLNSDLSQLIYSTYFGGSGFESGLGLHFDQSTLVATLAGRTTSTAQTFPVSQSPYKAALTGSDDGYVAKIQLLPVGIERIGLPTPCQDALTLETDASAAQSAQTFQLLTFGAPPSALGGLALSFRPVSGGVKLPPPLGATIYIDLNATIFFAATSSATGTHVQSASLTKAPIGARGWVQSYWFNPTSGCKSGLALSTSMALDITVQK